MTNTEGTKSTTVVDSNDAKGVLKNIGGSQSDHWNKLLAHQAVQALWLKNSDPETLDGQVSATLAALVGIGPRDELEGMMAAQLIAAHRWSASDPNIQQLPHDVETRRIIVAAPGHVLVDVDYSQMELRAAAWISGDAVPPTPSNGPSSRRSNAAPARSASSPTAMPCSASPPPSSSRSTRTGQPRTASTSTGTTRISDRPNRESPDFRLLNRLRRKSLWFCRYSLQGYTHAGGSVCNRLRRLGALLR